MHLVAEIARRMLNQGLTTGFSVWTAHVHARVHARERLRRIANHLRMPAVAFAFSCFVATWEGARRAAAAAAAHAQHVELRASQAALSDLSLIHI